MENVSFSGSSSTKKAKAKLPKLDLQTFNGKPQDWPEFGDTFSSIIEQDEDLPDAVKFQYLKKSLLEPAKSDISRFKITVTNYKAVVDLLGERYAKPTLIKPAHINEMLNIKDLLDERQVEKMRAFHDTVETHYRGPGPPRGFGGPGAKVKHEAPCQQKVRRKWVQREPPENICNYTFR